VGGKEGGKDCEEKSSRLPRVIQSLPEREEGREKRKKEEREGGRGRGKKGRRKNTKK